MDEPCKHKAIKLIDKETRRIGAYATIWGELDCDNDRMTKEAILPYVGKGAPYMFWLHGLDDHFGANVVGVWDTGSFKADDQGLYVEGNVGNDSYGDEAWERINEAGAFGLSVGSFWYLVKRKVKADGSRDITDWPLLDISLMEGGRQCVPSARQNIKLDIEAALSAAAKSFGINTRHQNGGRENINSSTKENSKMSEQQNSAVDISKMVAEQVKALLDAKEAEVVAEKERQAAIETKAQEIATKKVEEAKAEWETEKSKLEQSIKDNQTQKRPQSPPVANEGRIGLNIKMITPYDRFDTVDLATRYMLLKSWGKQPSERMWRSLAQRVIDITRQEDTLFIKNGKPHKVPAVDWDVLVPRNLDLSEDAGPEIAGKSVNFSDSSDVVSKAGLHQFYEIALKADELVYSTQAGYGDEWVPTLQSAELWRTIRLNAAVLGALDQFDMPSQPYDWSTESTDPTWYKVAEAADESQLVLTGGPFTDSKIASAKVTFSAGKLGGITYWSEEMEEDSVIAFEPQMRDQYGMSMAHAVDELLISGDETTGTSNISYDGASIGSTSRFLILDGLRHQPIVTTTADARDAGALTVDDFGITRSLMGTAGKFGVSPTDLIYIMDPGVWHKAYLLSEVLTVDSFGPAATIITGQLGSLFGIPLIVSEDYSLTDSAGKISSTGGNNTLGSFLCVNRRGVRVGWRRRPRIRVVGLPGAEARFIVASARLDIGFKEVGMVAASYNVTV